MAENWATRRHSLLTRGRVVAAAEEKSRAWRRLTHWLSLGLLSTCRSSDDDPNGGVPSWNGAITGKVHRRVFPALQRSDNSGGF